MIQNQVEYIRIYFSKEDDQQKLQGYFKILVDRYYVSTDELSKYESKTEELKSFVQTSLFFVNWFKIPFEIVKILIVYYMTKALWTRFTKKYVLYSVYFTFIYFTTQLLNDGFLQITFACYNFLNGKAALLWTVYNLAKVVLIPPILFAFLRALDKEDYDYYIGKDARGPSFHIFDITAPITSIKESSTVTDEHEFQTSNKNER
jgi:hypothetical protein